MADSSDDIYVIDLNASPDDSYLQWLMDPNCMNYGNIDFNGDEPESESRDNTVEEPHNHPINNVVLEDITSDEEENGNHTLQRDEDQLDPLNAMPDDAYLQWLQDPNDMIFDTVDLNSSERETETVRDNTEREKSSKPSSNCEIFEDVTSDEDENINDNSSQRNENHKDESITVVDEYIASDNENEQMGGQTEFDPENFYNLGDESEQRVKRFRTVGQTRNFFLKNLDQCGNLYEYLPQIFDHALKRMTSGIDENALAGAAYYHPDLNDPILVHFRPLQNLNGQMIVDQFERVLQSNQNLNIENPDAIIKIVTVEPPVGSGYHQKNRFFSNADFLKRKCFIKIKNKDNLCLARAIVTAIARIHRKDKTFKWNYSTMRHGDGKRCALQHREALQLMKAAGLGEHKGMCGLPELDKIQRVLPDYKIKLFSKECYGAIVYEGAVKSNKIIYLYHHDKHYTVINSMAAFYSNSYWCEDCNKAYSNKEDHRCINKCTSCYQCPPCEETQILLCEKCNRLFRNPICFENHLKCSSSTGSLEVLENKKRKTNHSVCERIQRCKVCNKHLKRAYLMNHKCGMFECRVCKAQVEQEGHLCYMQKEKKDDDEEDGADEPTVTTTSIDSDDDNEQTEGCFAEAEAGFGSVNGSKKDVVSRFVFFDFETSQERVLKETELGSELLHIPVLCIAHVVCDECNDRDYDIECGRCGPKKRSFSGDDCLNQFGKFLFDSTRKNTIAIAHNAQGFDSHFLLRYLYNEGIAPKVVMKGLNIISITVGSIKIIDSCCFLPMPLSALPKAFGFEEICKGYFPHLFTKKDNWNYIGAWPDIKYYCPESLKPEAYEKLCNWYSTQKDKTFNFQEELFKYCDNDVYVLRIACMKFRKIFIGETSIDPFEKSLTIAGACSRVFRKLFLKPNTIGLIPANGYNGKDKHSAIAIIWIKWLSNKIGVKIKHAVNGKEVLVGKYKVDGLAGKTVYKFYGCYWHGCPKCMKQRNTLTADQYQTARDAYTRTMERKYYIENCGYKMVELWECQLNAQLQQDPEMRIFFQNNKVVKPINPRDAFFGGRTNAVQLYRKIKTDCYGSPLEKIHYVDVCSLYPYTNKYGLYPIGHPEIITENFELVDREHRPYEGLIKCKILPPGDLYHPVLPYRTNNKLIFPLCATCADDQNMARCSHDDNERALFGTWVTLEVYKAIEKGYRILKIYEVWHYKETDQYDRESKPDGGLFTEYVNTFMKMKIEADGWPSKRKDSLEKMMYINDVQERESIKLDPANVDKNPGKRALAKLMLNSFWGKFGQRNNLAKTAYFTDPKEYFDLVTNDTIIIYSITIISDAMVAVTYAYEDEFTPMLPYTNAVIAAYTTAQARLTLYSYLEKLDRRVLYFDTDSIIYISNMHGNNDTYEVPVGWSLGEMTNELKEYGDNSFITEFVSGGPKNYAYSVYSTTDKQFHYVTKVRGITLSHETTKKVNFMCLKSFVSDFVKEQYINELYIMNRHFARKRDHQIVTRNYQKIFRIVYDKRIVLNNFYTLPYGWKLPLYESFCE